jgi:hypothetical protein
MLPRQSCCRSGKGIIAPVLRFPVVREYREKPVFFAVTISPSGKLPVHAPDLVANPHSGLVIPSENFMRQPILALSLVLIAAAARPTENNMRPDHLSHVRQERSCATLSCAGINSGSANIDVMRLQGGGRLPGNAAVDAAIGIPWGTPEICCSSLISAGYSAEIKRSWDILAPRVTR